jgi:hypothetical protein
MAKATHNLSRRSLFAAAAVIPAAALSTIPALASPDAADPIFAAIRRHRAAHEKSLLAIRQQCDLEEIVPHDLRKAYHVEHRGTDVGRDDDPRWTAGQDHYWVCSDEADEAAMALLSIVPDTMAGTAALLSYAAEYSCPDKEWAFPDDLVGDEFEDGKQPPKLGGYRDWRFFVLRNAAQALSSMGA